MVVFLSPKLCIVLRKLGQVGLLSGSGYKFAQQAACNKLVWSSVLFLSLLLTWCHKIEWALNLVVNSSHIWFFLSILYWRSLGMWTKKIFGFSSVLITSKKSLGPKMCHLLPWTMKIALFTATSTTNQKNLLHLILLPRMASAS